MMNEMNEKMGQMSSKIGQVGAKATDMLDKGAEEVKQSGQDWVCYIKKHPVQSILFGLIGYFALKGLSKD